MLLNIDFQIWKACANDAAGRPSLSYVSLVADPDQEPGSDGFIDGKAMATDGYILAIVPIKLYRNDEDGLIDPAALMAAYKVAKKAKTAELSVDLSREGLVGLTDRSWLPRWIDETDPALNFPDVSSIIPNRPAPTDRTKPVLMALSVQPGNIERVTQAIGCQVSLYGRGSGTGNGTPRLIPGGADINGLMIEPMIVEPTSAKIDRTFDPPFGLIMPCFAAGHDPIKYWNQK